MSAKTTNASFRCPDCLIDLVRVEGVRHHAWTCPSCDGTALTFAVLRQNLARASFDALWRDAQQSAHATARRCPSCTSMLQAFSYVGERGEVDLETCRVCSILWFDATELGQLGVSLAKAESDEARRAKAQLDVSLTRETKAEIEKVASLADFLRSLFRSGPVKDARRSVR